MPRGWKPKEEREKENFIRERDKQLETIRGVLATTKYAIPSHEIEKKVEFSKQVISKVRNTPIDATLGQLYEFCHAVGKKVVITIE